MIEPNAFDVLKKMCENNEQTFRLFPNGNLVSVTKDGAEKGWSLVSMAVDNETAEKIAQNLNPFLPTKTVVGLLVWDLDVYNRIKKELQGKTNE